MRSTFAVRETASLGIMGAPRVPLLYPSESIVLWDNDNLSGSFCRKLFGAIDYIKVKRVFDSRSPQGYSVSKSIARQISKVLYQARLDFRTWDLSLNKSPGEEHATMWPIEFLYVKCNSEWHYHIVNLQFFSIFCIKKDNIKTETSS